MGFEKFGRRSFIAATKVAPFVDFLAEGKIKGTVCKECGDKFFPPRGDCTTCFSDDVDWFDMPTEGTLATFTTAMYAPFGFEADTPYTMGLVDFPDGLKLFARLSKDIDTADLAIGMAVSVRTLEYDDGQLSFEIVKA
jgi:hypothetical protein